MPSLRSILSLLALGSVIVESPVPKRLIQKALYMLGMIVFICISVGAFLLAAIIYGYQALVEHGYQPLEAGLYLLGGMAVLVIIAIISSISAGRQLVEEMKFGIKKSVPLTTHLTNEVSSVAEAFIRGLINRNRKY